MGFYLKHSSQTGTAWGMPWMAFKRSCADWLVDFVAWMVIFEKL